MSVFLEANYAKKIGLPGYSSHQYAVTLRIELGDLTQLEKTNAELFARLQTAVDSQIVNAGHLPGETTRAPSTTTSAPANRLPAPVPVPATSAPAVGGDNWACSEKQRGLIQKIISENQLDPGSIETLAQERFRTGLRFLNRLQASSLIDELIETHPRADARRDRRPAAYAGRGRP